MQTFPLDSASRPFLAADVGGTHVRVGLIRAGNGEGLAIEILSYRKYRCADHPSLSAILSDFASHNPPVEHCVIATAGYALADGSVISANLPWPLSANRIRDDLGFQAVHLVNDFEAVAHAAAHIDGSQVLQLTGPAEAPRGPLAASTELEMAVLQQMLRNRSHVSIEHGALSGPGLLNLYNALCAVRGTAPVHATPDAVSAAACDASDPLAVETLQLFCGILGSTIGDMALLYGVQGGIYLPVKLVEHGQLGVIGAASWYLEKLAK
ncbi:hypothetical protein ASF01_15545 [Stenotrophomonas sp. Leaf70]|nr:hypothetical protein ASF01_15545 [Stenotrophomonas sp. Leaf70]